LKAGQARRAGLALQRWTASARKAQAWRTDSGAVIALTAGHGLKLQSRRLGAAERVRQSVHEQRAARRLPRARRAVLAVLWFDPRSATLRTRRSHRHAEPALLMHRLDAEDLGARLDRDPAAATALAQDFGRLLARFHRRSPVLPVPGEPDAEAHALQRLEAQWRHFRGEVPEVPPACWPRVEAVVRLARARLALAAPLLHERARQGLRRDGHGDLHSGNLHLWRGRATLLDLLPFRSHRAHDVASDLGQLAFEFRRLAGVSARQALLAAYGDGVPPPLVDYFEAKALLVDLAVLARSRGQGKPWPRRATRLLGELPAICRGLLGEAGG
jgi:hypothetical protein